MVFTTFLQSRHLSIPGSRSSKLQTALAQKVERKGTTICTLGSEVRILCAVRYDRDN